MTFRLLFPLLLLLNQACQIQCDESNEIPAEDCAGCDQKAKLKTEIVTYSVPAWKAHVRGTATTKKPADANQRHHSTVLIGTTNVVTHEHPDPDATTDPAVETAGHTTRGYTTQGWAVSVTYDYTSSSPDNQVTTKEIEETSPETVVPKSGTDPVTGDDWYNTNMFSPLPSSFELTSSDEPSTEGQVVTTQEVAETTEGVVVFSTEGEIVTTDGAVVTTEGAVVTTEEPVVTTEGVVVTTQGVVVTTKGNVVTTDSNVVTTDSGVTTASRLVTTEEEVVIIPTRNTEPDEIEDDDESDDEGLESDDDNEVDDDEEGGVHKTEHCIDHDPCFNGGDSVCESNGGDFLYCICQVGYDGTYCEQERPVAKVDVNDREGGNGFWDWKLSKYIIGGLAALTILGLLMLTCMVVVKVRQVRQREQKKAAGLREGGNGDFYPASTRRANPSPGSRSGQRLF